MKRMWLTVLVLFVAACRGAPAEPSRADAGAPAPHPTLASQPRALAPIRAASPAPSRRRSGLRRPGPQIAAPKPDAGAPHKLGLERPPVVNPYWLVPNWYVNALTGNDDNTCQQIGSPCKSVAKIVSLWGTSAPTLPGAVTITFQTDEPSNTDWFAPAPVLPQGASLTVLGTWTTQCSGSLGTVTAKNYGAVADGRLHINLGACAAGNQGMAIVDVTRSSSVGHVDECSGNVCAISQPMSSNVPTFSTISGTDTEDDGWTAGDSFTIQRPTKVNIASYRPTVVGDTGATNLLPTGGYMGHVWVPNYGGGVGSSFAINSYVAVVESRVDGLFETVDTFVNNNEATAYNDWCPGVNVLLNAFIVAGSYSTVADFGLSFSGVQAHDTIVHGQLSVSQRATDYTEFGSVYVDSVVAVFQDSLLIADYPEPPQARIYGTYTLQSGTNNPSEATLNYYGTASAAFVGVPTMSFCNAGNVATAVDDSVFPVESYSNRPLTPAALDAPIGGFAGSGFNGRATCDTGATLVNAAYVPAASPAAYFNCGSGLTCTQNSPGTGQLTIASSVDGGVTSVSGTLPITVSPTTGAPVVSIGTVGAAHSVALWEGAGAAMGSASPGASAFPLVSNGTGSNPTFQALAYSTLTGAPTIPVLPTLTAHSIVLGQGTTTPTFLGACAAGGAAWSNGTDWQCAAYPYSFLTGVPTAPSVLGGTGITVTGGPAYTVALTVPETVPNGGTGNIILAAGSVLLGNGTGAVLTAAPVTAGNVLTSTGSTWASAPPPLIATYGANAAGVSVGSGLGTPVIIAQVTFTVPSGGAFASISVAFNQLYGTNDVAGTYDGSYGIGVDTSASLTQGHAWTEPLTAESQVYNLGWSSLYRTSLSAGTHNIYALATSVAIPSGGTDSWDADLLVTLTTH